MPALSGTTPAPRQHTPESPPAPPTTTTSDTAANAPAPASPPAPHTPSAVFDGVDGPRYARGELLGSGGMGRVVLARDQRFDRAVALKEVPPGLDPAYAARLAREAAIAARLDHPGIVPVHDAGRHPDGTVFFAMRVVRGRSLAELLHDGTTPRERLFRAVLAAAEAVGWAHAMGVVHRDLKPANIMVGEFGETQVVDWGLAREGVAAVGKAGQESRKGTIPGAAEPMAAAPSDDAALTRAGTVVGTPQYMAPEQAQGLPADARSDVFSLGAVLFELLAGRPPHTGPTQDDVLAAAAFRAPPRLGSVASDAPPELAAIVDKALARAPEARYPNGKALADDLARYLDGRRVAAHTYSRTELLRRVWRAWRVPILVGAVSFVAVAVAVIVALHTTSVGRTRAEQAEAAARAAAETATTAEAATRRALTAADDNLARALAAQAIAQPRGARAEAEVLAVHALALRESPLARGLLAAWEAAPRPTVASERPIPETCAHPLVGPDGELACRESIALALRRIAPGYRAAWNGAYLKVDSGSGSWTVMPCKGATLGAVAFDDDTGRWAAFCIDGAYGTGFVQQQAPANPAEQAEPAASARLETPLPVSAAAFIPGTNHALVGTTRGDVARIDLATGSLLTQLHVADGAIFDIDVSADGALGAALGDRGGVALWDIRDQQLLHHLPTHWARALRFAATDARLLWTAGPTIRAWRLPESRAVAIDAGAGVTAVVARGGSVGVTTGKGVLMIDGASGAVRWREAWPAGTVKHGAFLADDTFFATNAGDTTLRTWDVGSGAGGAVLVDGEEARGRRVATVVGAAGPVALIATYAGGLQVVHGGRAEVLLAGNFMDLAVSADGRAGVVLREEPREACRLEVVGTGAGGVRVGGCHAVPGAVAVAVPNGGATVLVAKAHAVEAVDASGAVVARYAVDTEAGGHLGEIEIDAGARFVAAGDGDGTTWIWRQADGRLLARIRDHRERVTGLAFDGAGRLWTGSWDGTVRVRSLAALEAPVAELRARIDAAWALSLERVVDAR